MTKTPSPSLNPVVRVDFPHAVRLGRGKIALLEHIRETGSISAAGRAMDMSYRRAWLLVSALNAMFVEEAVSSQRGGKQGGGAIVTPFGAELIRRFRSMEDKAKAAIADDLTWLDEKRSLAVDAGEGPSGLQGHALDDGMNRPSDLKIEHAKR